MSGDGGRLKAMWLLPFAAAADKAHLTLKRQNSYSEVLISVSRNCDGTEVFQGSGTGYVGLYHVPPTSTYPV